MKIYFFFLLLCFVPNFYFCFLISEKCSSPLWRMQKQLNTMPKQTNYFQHWVSQSFFQKCFLLFMTFQKSSVFVNGIYSYFWKFLKENKFSNEIVFLIVSDQRMSISLLLFRIPTITSSQIQIFGSDHWKKVHQLLKRKLSGKSLNYIHLIFNLLEPQLFNSNKLLSNVRHPTFYYYLLLKQIHNWECRNWIYYHWMKLLIHEHEYP